MSTRFFTPLVCLSCLSTLAAGQNSASTGQPPPPAEPAIRLSGIGDYLHYPPPAGENRILVAHVTGAPIKAIWLATRADAPRRVPLSRVEAEEYQVNLYAREVAELAAGDDAATEFRVYVETPDGAVAASLPICYQQRGVPRRLDFGWDSATVRVAQRRSIPLPGSHERLRLCLGDITGGAVGVSVQALGTDKILPYTTMRPGGMARLNLENGQYVLVLERLVNYLTAEDYAVFSLSTAEAWKHNEVEQLLQRIAAAPVKFLREEQEFTGEQFAAYLREKMAFTDRLEVTADAFVADVASKSSTTGKPYRVKLGETEVVDAEPWLRAELAAIRQEPAPRPQSTPAP